MKKIMISDYDRTLYTNDKDMLINIKKIKEFRKVGNVFVIATGRTYKHLESEIEKFNIDFDYLILSHGSVVLDKNKKVLKVYGLEKTVVEKILSEICEIHGTINYGLYSVFDKVEITDCDDIMKVIIKFNTMDMAEKVSDFVNNNFPLVKSYALNDIEFKLVEIVSSKADKSKAIKDILVYEKIRKKDVFTIGDSHNDVEMIKEYNGWGMKNSKKCVLNVTNRLHENVYNLIDEIL
jgi:HAD-superfamily hydrolase, subfamily IIB